MNREDVDELARRCQQETDTYRRTGRSDPFPCLTLFRLALEENREDAWNKIIELYTVELRKRFYKHAPWNSLIQEDQDDIVLETFERFAEQNRKKPLQISSLEGVLKYLYLCLSTVILLHKRAREKEHVVVDRLHHVTDMLEPDPADWVARDMAAQEIWQQVKSCCDNSCEEQVMYHWLGQHDTASEIVQDLSACHLTIAKVYQIVEKVLRRYRKRYSPSGDSKFGSGP